MTPRDMTPRAYSLVAELTYRCPLRCAYCSNPVRGQVGAELDGETWRRVLSEAEALGVVHVSFTGGEPLLHADLESLVAEAARLDVYPHLVTSGVPLERARLERLRDAGLAALQLSLQDTDAAGAVRVAGRDALEAKRRVAAWADELGLPLTVNIVLHRENIGRVAALIAEAEALGARRIELANAQYHGWAAENVAALLPSRAAIEEARLVAREARSRLEGRAEVLFVLADHHGGRPRACMGGWAQRTIVVAPDGLVLPCHAARELPLPWPGVGEAGLEEIWTRSPAFAAYRGEDWMREPCKSCDRRGVDFGGCRCQAFALTGDAAATDPACALSPHHALIETRVAAAGGVTPLRLRRPPIQTGRSA